METLDVRRYSDRSVAAAATAKSIRTASRAAARRKADEADGAKKLLIDEAAAGVGDRARRSLLVMTIT